MCVGCDTKKLNQSVDWLERFLNTRDYWIANIVVLSDEHGPEMAATMIQALDSQIAELIEQIRNSCVEEDEAPIV